MKQNQAELWAQLETRLIENRSLNHGGIPQPLRAVASLVGLHPWQTLLLSSFLLTGFLLLIFGPSLIVVAERSLLIRP